MKIGITCDNYKLESFRERLNAENFVFTEDKFTKGTTFISIITSPDKVEVIRKICIELEMKFHQSN